MNYVNRIAPPSILPFDQLQEVKDHLKAGDDEDDLIRLYLNSAIVACENKLQTAIMNTEFELHAPCFQGCISLQKKFVSVINSVKYYDADGALQTVSSGDYSLQDFKEPNVLSFDNGFSFPGTDSSEYPVVVNFNAGFTSASGCLPNLKTAILLEVGDRYENRQNEIVNERVETVMFNTTADAICAEERLWI